MSFPTYAVTLHDATGHNLSGRLDTLPRYNNPADALVAFPQMPPELREAGWTLQLWECRSVRVPNYADDLYPSGYRNEWRRAL